MRRSFLATVASAGASLIAGRALAQSPDGVCIGRHTVRGAVFRGVGGAISDPFYVREGAVFARSRMSAAGGMYLMDAAGRMVLLRNAIGPGPVTEANSVLASGEYYLVIDFYGDDGPWSVTIEQPPI